ncbi:MAG: tRNA uridine-5-carboxymethylaminomethyl(34) synthesis GTPase MnmE [Lentisphaerae bacterium]|jgi:tRNA modification GTPase|nr:tRNA uridine-5-carboxymethylaminomethyl(34) synthesis GTPase MnmE [Lentisphaerota bacterium]
MELFTGTIAAIATAAGAAGVAIIRISGSEALKIATRVVKSRRIITDVPRGCFFYAEFVDPETGESIDNGVVLIFRGPGSFTGEDVVELQGHGGDVVSGRLLEAVFAAGATPAAAGEFTRRAFLNGRLDLTQAEAVIDLIQAQTARAARAAHEQAQGALRHHIERLYNELIVICADIEAMLDFDEGELPESFLDNAHIALTSITAKMSKLCQTRAEGALLRKGLLVVIAGKVNAGKSSLLNAMLEMPRAIVTSVPGTTRDTIEESFSFKGIPLRLTDTAGIRNAPGEAEQAGVARTQQVLQVADIILYVVDGTAEVDQFDRDMLRTLPPQRTILLINKSDHSDFNGSLAQKLVDQTTTTLATAECNTLSSEGLSGLFKSLDNIIKTISGSENQGVTVSERHYQELNIALTALNEAQLNLATSLTMVIAAASLRQGAEALGRITGRVYSNDLLDTIFSRFCVGK